MNVGDVSQRSAANPTQEVADMNQEVFLRLLLTELQNQDPMNPLEGREFIAQLATLAQVEQTRKTNEALELLLQYQSSINNAQAVSLLGKKVRATGDEFTYSGANVELSFYLEQNAASVDVKIYDSAGKIVRTMSLGAQNEGLVNFKWDGLDNRGNKVPNGNYKFDVTAKDENGKSVFAQTLMEGVVSGLSFDTDGLHLIVNGHKVSLSEIYEVMTD